MKGQIYGRFCSALKVAIAWAIFGVLASGMDYSSCKMYYNQATLEIDSKRVFSVLYNGKPHLIAYSKTPLYSSKIIKKDVFLGLYLFKGQANRSYTLKPLDSYAHTLPLAAINAKEAISGKLINFEKGIFDLGKFSANLPLDSVISTICYQTYGISAGGQYFVPKVLIERFLSAKGGIYGDIGVRVGESRDGGGAQVVVRQIDAFFPNNVFLPNDVIKEINGKAIKSLAEFEWSAANLAPNTSVNVKILRKGKVLNVKSYVDKRYGGGLLRDTFLERFGVIVDNDFVIQKMEKQMPFEFGKLSVGDQFVWIDKTEIRKNDGFAHFRELLSQAKARGKVELLMLHEGVEIFLNSAL